MLFIETQFGNFRHFKDIYLYMQEENLKQIEITKVEYCLDKIFGSDIYTLEQIKQIIQ